jgi:hypothetical protein
LPEGRCNFAAASAMHRQDSSGQPKEQDRNNAKGGSETIPEKGITAHSDPHKMWEQMWFRFFEKVIYLFKTKR